jgi:hypothetical protein
MISLQYRSASALRCSGKARGIAPFGALSRQGAASHRDDDDTGDFGISVSFPLAVVAKSLIA